MFSIPACQSLESIPWKILLLAVALINCNTAPSQLSMSSNVDCNRALLLPECHTTVRDLISKGKFGFHITAQENLQSIRTHGLLVAQGGGNPKGLCALLGNSDCSTDRTDALYQERSQGYIFFAKNLDVVEKYEYLHQRLGSRYMVLGIRLDGLGSMGYERDPEDGGRGAYRTKQNIPPTHLVNLGDDIRQIRKQFLPQKRYFPCFRPS